MGDPLTLTCTGSDCVGTTTFTFSWLLDGRPVEAGLLTDNDTMSQLSVTSVTSADLGMYSCEMMSIYGTGTAVVYVRETGELHILYMWALSDSWLTPLVIYKMSLDGQHFIYYQRKSYPVY